MTTNMKEPAQLLRIEPRWPVVLAILAAILMVVLLPERVVLFPAWFPYVMGIALILPMAVVGLSGEKTRWLPVERMIMLLFLVAMGLGTLANLANLISTMVDRSAEIWASSFLLQALWCGSATCSCSRCSTGRSIGRP